MAAQSPMKPSERVGQIIALYAQGKTLQEIGDQFLVTRERIRQILAKAGVGRNDGGQHAKSIFRSLAKKAQKDKRCVAKYGMNFDQVRSIQKSELDKPFSARATIAYSQQKKNAHQRGIQFNLTFSEWWSVWQQSGKWNERGKGADKYVMARFGDEGAYEIGNIYITTLSKNTKHYQESRQGKQYDDWNDVFVPEASNA